MKKSMLLVIFSLLFATHAFADSIKIVTQIYPPYEFTKNNSWTGHDVDIVKEACKRLGITPVFEELPWKRCLKNMEEGKSEAMISLFKTPERQEYMLYPETNLSYEKNVIFTGWNNHITVNSLKDLSGKTIGVQDGYSYGSEFDNYQGLKTDISYSQKLLLKKYHSQRVDFIIGNESVLLHLNKELKMPPLKVVYVVSKDPLYMGFSKAHPQGKRLFKQFNETLFNMKKEGVIDKIIKTYQ